MTMTVVWIGTGAWLVVVLWTVATAIGDLRFSRAQHRAFFEWERTGQVVAGWSRHWRWSHPKDVESPALSTTVINNFFTTIVNVVNVTHVNVRALVLPGRPGRGGGSGAAAGGVSSGAADIGVPRVISGQVVRALPDAAQGQSGAAERVLARLVSRGGEGR
jgi:hypothetical protein